jgi:hypothetical protein
MTVKVGLVETVTLPALFRRVRPDECTWTIEGGASGAQVGPLYSCWMYSCSIQILTHLTHSD